MTARRRSALLGLGVALVLADSSVVTLALPALLREYDLGIPGVAWVLTSYNLALALAAVPAAHLARRAPRATAAAGLIVFAVASLVCGLAPSLTTLLAARCVQAVGGAAVIAAALDLLRTTEGEEPRAARYWARAGVLGAGIGPAAGGILTQAFGWESIFLLQVPLALGPLAAIAGLEVVRAERARAGRPHLAANLALVLASAALSAALFLLVILLVNGWRLEPALAGLVVTVMPAAAIAAAHVATAIPSAGVRAASGLVGLAGGLGGLALLPHADWAWTLAPQVLVGAGLGLTLSALTERALHGRSAQGVHGGWTIASRHAGVVVGLLILTPLLTSALERNQQEAERAATAIVLDSEIAPLEKVRVAQDVLARVEQAEERVPDVRPALAARFEGDDGPEMRRVADGLQDQLDRAVTNAFSGPFLLAAALALGALATVVVARGRVRL